MSGRFVSNKNGAIWCYQHHSPLTRTSEMERFMSSDIVQFLITPSKARKAFVKRFRFRVVKTDYCWNWVATKHARGYGKLIIKWKAQLAHRVSWMLKYGRIPGALLVCHKCDNPSCVRPGHLFLGTTQDNIADKVAKGRQARGQSNGKSVLSESEVVDIRRKYKTGNYSQADLGFEYGIHQTHVGFIVRRVTWRHVE